MPIRAFLVAIATFFITDALSQTSVGGTLFQNTQWTLAGSPYTLTGTVGVAPGAILTIDAGVQVAGSFDLLVKGIITVNGSQEQPVQFQNTRLIFKSTNLSQSTIQHTQFDHGGVQLADETEFSQDNPQNSNTLVVSNSTFTNNAYLRTKGYMTTARLKCLNCSVANSAVTGFYPRSEPIEFDQLTASNSTFNSDSYNYGFIISNSRLTSVTMLIGCCGANLAILGSTLSNCSITEGDGQPIVGPIILSKDSLINTYVSLPSAQVSIDETQINASAISQSYLISMGFGRITNSSFIGNSGLTLIKVSGYNGYNVGGSIVISRNNFDSYGVGVEIDKFQSINIDSCNFQNGITYHVKNLSNMTVPAPRNYWGTTDTQIIDNKIFDIKDDLNYGLVDYSDFSTSIVNTNPSSAPANVYKGQTSTGLFLYWTASNNENTLGYKIYKKTNGTYEFVVDAGNVNSFTVTDGTLADDFAVTSYNEKADGINDQPEGNESVYSNLAIPFFQLEASNTAWGCEGGSAVFAFKENFPFNDAVKFQLMVSSVENDFSQAISVSSIINPQTPQLTWSLPDTLKTDRTFYYEIVSNFFDVSSVVKPFQIRHKPAIDFTYTLVACPIGGYQLKFIGVSESGLSLSWHLLNDSTKSGDSVNVTSPAAADGDIILAGTLNGCISTITKTVHVIGCTVTSLEKTEEFRIFPNPSSDRVEFQAESDGQFELIDGLGRSYLKGTALAGLNEIFIGEFPSGVYILKVSGQKVISAKVLKN